MLTPVISPAEVKAWCRVDGTADDALLTMLIATAQEQAEAYCGQTYDPMTCPQSIRSAVAVMAADLYANREGQVLGTNCFLALLAPHRASIF